MFHIQHLQENNQSYFQHMKDAFSLAGKSFLATISFFVHGVFPMIFTHTGSDWICDCKNFIEEKNKIHTVAPVNDDCFI